MRKILIIANWKMHTSLKEGRELAREIDCGTRRKDLEIVLCPPFTHLTAVGSQIRNLGLGAQDVFWQSEGAYTGEISPSTLKEIGCKYVIIGHSERREHLQESDQMIARKLEACLAVNLTPVLCVGEKREEREKNKTLEVLEEQLSSDLKDVARIDSLVIAYEPVWSIGTGETAEPSDIEATVRYIRETIGAKYGQEKADKLRILYGGSVDSGNVQGFVQEKDINGVLVGGASVNSEEFIKIIKAINQF